MKNYIALLCAFIAFIVLIYEYRVKKSKYSYLALLMLYYMLTEVFLLMHRYFSSTNAYNLQIICLLIVFDTLLILYILSKALEIKKLKLMLLGALSIFFFYLIVLFLSRYNYISEVYYFKDNSNSNHLIQTAQFFDFLLIRGFIALIAIGYKFTTSMKHKISSHELKTNLIFVLPFIFYYVGLFYFLLLGRLLEYQNLSSLYDIIFDPLNIAFYALITVGSLWRSKY